jgi:hypothetical protein
MRPVEVLTYLLCLQGALYQLWDSSADTRPILVYFWLSEYKTLSTVAIKSQDVNDLYALFSHSNCIPHCGHLAEQHSIGLSNREHLLSNTILDQ